MKFQFNTGAFYSDEGQVIVIVIADVAQGNLGPMAFFSDKSRGINGCLQLTEMPTSEAAAKRLVMHAYNYNDYQTFHSYNDQPELLNMGKQPEVMFYWPPLGDNIYITGIDVRRLS